MLKTINPKTFETENRNNTQSILYSFRSVFFLLCAATIFFSSNRVCGQPPSYNPYWLPMILQARVTLQTPSGPKDIDVRFDTPKCKHYRAYYPGAWNGKFSNAGKPLSNIDASNIGFPFDIKVPYNGTSYDVSVTEADVDAFWEFHLFNSQNGYVKISGASLAMNCHGHATGLGYWLNSFGVLTDDDYEHKFFANDDFLLASMVGNDSHSMKLVNITKNAANQ